MACRKGVNFNKSHEGFTSLEIDGSSMNGKIAIPNKKEVEYMDSNSTIY
jgi:hypothetical protein